MENKTDETQENNTKQEKELKANELEVNIPEFNLGVRQASYLSGFAITLASSGVSEKSIDTIILQKMQLEYQKEMLRMQLETEESIAEKNSVDFVKTLMENNNK